MRRILRTEPTRAALLAGVAGLVLGWSGYPVVGGLLAALALLTLAWRVAVLRGAGARLVQAFERLGGGDGQVHLDTSGTDEATAAAFNRMADTVRAQLVVARESEQRLRSVVAALSEGLIVQDREGRITESNEAAARIIGLPLSEMLKSATSRPRVHIARPGEHWLELPQRPAWRALASGRTQHEPMLRILRADGSMGWAQIRSVPVAGSDGRPAFVVSTLTDLTQRVEAEEALQQLNEALELRVAERTRELTTAKDAAERANHAKSEFLSRMSHELRTPLNAILGFGQLLALRAADDSQAAQVREIIGAGQHLLTLIDEVLDLARVEAGKVTVSHEPVAVLPLLGDCLKLVQAQADARQVRLLPPTPSCEAHVRADRTRLKQVLLNLLSNAVKYNGSPGEVRVYCVPEPALEPPSIRLCVADTGPGLGPAQRAVLFRPFERLDADERQIQGSGIGLALCKRLVELMHGEIGVESSPGAGSTFWVRLPLARPHADPGPPPEASGAVADGTPAIERTVLCIEDNPANLHLIEGIFAHRPGVQLQTALTPRLGLTLARDHRPALILLDINLPEMDGYAVLECLRADPATREIPVVAVSASAMPRDLERARSAGFVDYVTKPIDVSALLELSDRILGAAGG